MPPPAPAPTALAQIPKVEAATVLKVADMKNWLAVAAPTLQKVMPNSIASNPERFARCLVTLMQTNYKLSTCTALSLMSGMVQTVQLGLELGGPLGQTYLVPRYNKHVKAQEANFQIGYRGLITLGFRSDKVGAIFAHQVREKDEFDLGMGSKPFAHYKPDPRMKQIDRGPPIGVFAVVRYVNGIEDVEWMNTDELEAHKAAFVHESSDPWNRPITRPEMEKKTVLRRLCKRVAVSVDIVKAAMLDEFGEAGQPQELTHETAQLLDINMPDPVSEEAEEVAATISTPKARQQSPRDDGPNDGGGDDGDPEYDRR